MNDLATFYEARIEGRQTELPALSEQFTEHTNREIHTYESGGYSDEISYWREELADLPPPIELESIVPRRGNRDWSVACPTVIEPPEVLASLKALAQNRRISLFSVLLSGIAVLLHHRTGEEDLLIGVSTANR